jgi:hypothetical protein
VIGAVLSLVGLVRKAPGQSALVAMAAAAALGLTYLWGLSNGKATVITSVASAQLAQAQQANEKLQERVREGERASMSLRDELAQRADQIQTLKWSLKHVPKLVATQACPAPGAVRLSVGAVRLYDAALGGDRRELPGRASGVAAPAAPATAAAAGEQPSAVTVDQFQDVAQLNAERFGECWVRFGRLVEHLNARGASAAAPGRH